MKTRKEIAFDFLCKWSANTFYYLGEGKSSVVYRDNDLVYKVFILNDYESLQYKQHLAHTIQFLKHKFIGSNFFYPIYQVIKIDENCFILTYPYEKGEVCNSFKTDEIQDFLAECWKKRLIFQDIKPENFIRVKGNLKWIDYEPDKFTDNLFLNMVVRAFIYTKFKGESQLFLKKLCRSAINQFDLVELKGVQEFTNRVYAKVIFQESIHSFPPKINNFCLLHSINEITKEGIFEVPYQDKFNAEKCYWELVCKNLFLRKVQQYESELDNQNYFSPKRIVLNVEKLYEPKKKVSLIIKACVQDTEVLYESVKHIIRQLTYPNSFDEKILALDIRQEDFLREYNGTNTWEELLFQAQRLVDNLVIDEFIYPDLKNITSINEEWFGLKTEITHTAKKVPVTSQLFAFEKAKNDHVLQMDCDVMIGRVSTEHSFLNDMMAELEENEQVLSVGFNIYKGKETNFTEYFGFENGGFVPEVRFCLLQKSRIKKLFPLKNEISNKGFKLSWYRAVEIMQKHTHTCSIRGGSNQSFYIHPQNFKKTNADVWFTTLDRIEQLQIPNGQINEFDLAGAYYDWAIPKRNETMVLISCFRDIPLSRFLRYWYSLISQTYQEWGLILIDDASENGISLFIKELIKPYQNRITFIQNRFRVGNAQNMFKAIHYFMQNQESIVCTIDADDALIGKGSLKSIYEKYTYWGADVVIGKMYRTDKLHAHYKYTPNFTHPRLVGGNVWQHLRSFRKYLFDSLDFKDLKITNKTNQTNNTLHSRRFSNKMMFPEYCPDFAYMVPIVEMSENPMFKNHFNIFHDRATINTPKIKQLKENEIAEILTKPSKSPKDVFKGRKTFLPNLNKIEIDITYDCNLKCINCNRSSTQAPIKEGMSLSQIQQFINESIELNKKWESINLLGGEPTIHIDFLKIVTLILREYIDIFSSKTILQITSNGFGDAVQEKLSKLPQHPSLIINCDSFKEGRVVPYFSPFNDAPIDNSKLTHNEYHKGCWVTSYCGIGLNQLGYYPCGVAGGIDRIFGFKLGIKSLKNVDEGIAQYLDKFCRFCGNFTDYENNQGNFIPRNEKSALTKPVMSESWKKAYRTYNGK